MISEELYQQMLAKALAHFFEAKLLLLDVTDFSLKVRLCNLLNFKFQSNILYLINHNNLMIFADSKQIWYQQRSRKFLAVLKIRRLSWITLMLTLFPAVSAKISLRVNIGTIIGLL